MSKVKKQIKEKIAEFPKNPGVYLMKNSVGRIIYVGKAKNVRNRVRSYFSEGKDVTLKTQFLVSQIRDIQYLLTKTEVEAFLLEASLIKKHKPKYNIRLKDDKAYPYIRISMADLFPRIYLSRKVKKDGSVYFGPYTSGRAVQNTIRFLNHAFQIRDCADAFMKSRKRPCLTHEIGRCTAPCVGFINEEDYRKNVQSALAFLRGKNKKVLKDLGKQMKECAKQQKFEQAAKLRDSIYAIERVLESQTVVNISSEVDQDAISFHGDERGVLIETLHVRQGRVIGSRSHFLPQLNLTSPEEDVREWLVDFINQYYNDNIVPDEVLLPVDLGKDMNELLQAVLQERAEHKVQVRYPMDAHGAKLLEMVETNVREHFKEHVSKSESKLKALQEIQRKFKLPDLPMRIECYDISHFQGEETVASQVVFEEGVPNTDLYRRYKLKTVNSVDDFKSMQEVLSRRLKHLEYEDPQLILIDGGKGQLSSVMKILKELEREDLPVASIAKSRTERDFKISEVQKSEERFFLPGRSNPATFRANSEALKILTNLRDEAHRFAITYHRKLREGSSLQSALDHIEGLGPKKKAALLKKFQTVEQIREAELTELTAVTGITEQLAGRILDNLNLEYQTTPYNKNK